MAKTPEQIYFQHEETLKVIEEYKKLPQRCKQLEQLCRDLYLCFMEEYVDYAGFTNRMEQLGLLDGEQND